EHHTNRVVQLEAQAQPPAMRAVALTGGGGKFGIELPTQRMIAGQGGNLGGNFGGSPMPPVAQVAVAGEGARGRSGKSERPARQPSLAKRPDLVPAAQVNERIRRKAIHERLSRLGAVRPHEIERWLYKEVLHVDLDDPKLGLDKVLTEN